VFDPIKKTLQSSSALEDILAAAQAKERITIKNAAGSLSSLLVSLLSERNAAPGLCIVPYLDQAEHVRDELAELLPQRRVAHFPPSKALPWGHRDAPTVTQQLEVVESLLNLPPRENAAPEPPPIIVATAKALFTSLVEMKTLAAKKIQIKVGDELPFETLLQQLVDMGFERQPVVEQPGELSVRGGIIDLYPFSRELPLRLEFWGDKIESIREFDPATQRSEKEITSVLLFPQNIEEEEGGRKSKTKKEVTLCDYLPGDTQVFVLQAEHIAASLADKNVDRDEEEWLGGDLAFEEDDDRWQEFSARIKKFPQIVFSNFQAKEAAKVFDCKAVHQPALHGDLKALHRELVTLRSKASHETAQIFLVCESASHAERLSELLHESGFDEFHLQFLTGMLYHGFAMPEIGLVVYTDHEFYGRHRRPQRRRRLKEGLTFRQLKSLSKGDFVVHVDHGIGAYQGLQHIKAGNHERECIVIHYEGNDRLFVPLDKMDRVQKYTSREAAAPKVHKLGSPDWDRLKARTKKRLKDIAKDLITLYAVRQSQKGVAFPPDTLWQKELEASFEYEETPDQTRAIEEVKKDMETERPMDRLVCGDVGFGKTEVAMRAAFKAVQDGKQVAILVPTTLLAQQHFNTFQERLNKYPVRIAMLSRFRTAKQQKESVEQLKKGEVDIIIGTHRLLSKDIGFKSLGLVVIDEEQRFGVRHKERLKGLKVHVDVLALSATPIPRTLHMSLMGVRDMTNINTPPRDRQPIHTEVAQFEHDLIRQAILREIHRGGQVFFVHNRVSSIYRMAGVLRRLIPEVEIGVAHGQMKEHELEKIMLSFVNRKCNVLVSTMIIESGLDLPNVNTMIINRADRFGLAQLYQLRGRVGRSSQKAFCYLLIPPIRNLTVEAIKRLETVEEYSDLGSGFRIAMRDLEIRGAGNLLGAEQSGMIDAIGFDLYTRILEEAVRETRRETMPETEARPVKHDECKVELDGDAYLPEDYVNLPTERVAIYRHLAEAKKLSEIEAIAEELKDRFGRLPVPAQNLLGLASVRLLGTILGLRTLRIFSRESFAVFAPEVTPAPGEPFKKWVGSIISRAPYKLEFFQNGGLGFRLQVPKGEAGLPATVRLLASLTDGEREQEVPKMNLFGY
jgi:transcription-repair coupling factor (superfamily II helicase)